MKKNYTATLKFIILAYAFSFAHSSTIAQEISLYFRHYTTENGLSQNFTKSITQDSIGYIWVGTEHGLNRFDGYEFKQFHVDNNKTDGLSSDFITALCTDKKNRLWIGSWGGLNYYNQKTNKFYSFRHNVHDKSSLLSNMITYVFVDSKNYLWVGTNKGLNRSLTSLDSSKKLDKLELKFLNFCAGKSDCNLTDNYINTIIEDHDHNIWIATNKGLNKFSLKTKKLYSYTLPQTQNVLNRINSITCGLNGDIWLGTNAGLYKFDVSNNLFLCYANEPFFKKDIAANQIKKVLIDHKGALWIGTQNVGIVHFNIETNTYKVLKKEQGTIHSLEKNSIENLFVDKSNNIFVLGVSGLDVAKIENMPFGLKRCYRNEKGKILSNTILSVYSPNKQQVWLGFRHQGLSLYDRQSKSFENFHFDKINNGKKQSIKAIYPKNSNELLLGTRNSGLLLFNTKTGGIKQFKHNETDSNSISSNFVFFITKDKKGYYWVATHNNGLNKFDEKTGLFTRYLHDEKDTTSIGHSAISHVLIDSGEKIWLATFGGGLNLLNEKTGKFKQFKHEFSKTNSISSNYVTHIYESSDGNLWVGTARGLNKFNRKTGDFMQFTYENGLSDEFIYGILEDNKSNIWVSTNQGLFKLDKITEKFTNYDIESGLQDNEFNVNAVCKTPDNMFLFAGMKGFNLFNPDSIKNRQFVPNIAITSFQLFYNEVEIGKKYNNRIVLSESINNIDTLSLHYKNNQLSFEFAAFDYTKPKAINYAIRIKGLSDVWSIVPPSKRYVSFTNLKPGNYVFEIKSTNSDGVWSDNVKQLHILINPAFWQQTWFNLLILLFIFMAIYLFIKIRIKWLIVQQNRLKQLVKIKTEAISSKNIELWEQTEELNQLAELLKNSNIDLEKKVKKRTKKLKKALDGSKEAEKLISSFLSNLSHEIRTPMNAINGFSQLISDPDLSPEQRINFSDIINKNVDTLLVLIDNIMNISKLHTGHYVIKNSSFSLNDLFIELFADFKNKTQIINKNVDFKLDISSKNENITLFSDRDIIKQIIYQLVDNALKYTEKGKVSFGYRLELPKTEIENPGLLKTLTDQTIKKTKNILLNLTIFVNDSGVGIDKKQQQNIFNAFKKVENKEKLFRGTGLGLAIVKNLTEKLNAKINLQSEMNKGTRIKIKIPLSNS